MTKELGHLHQVLSSIDWDFKGYVPGADRSLVRSLHWYPAPFPAGLAATLIDILAPTGGIVVDPFCGSGIGPFEAWLSGRFSVGIDVNRFAIELGKARVDLVLHATPSAAEHLNQEFLNYRSSCSGHLPPDPGQMIEMAGIHPEAARWFAPDILRDIACMKLWIDLKADPRWKHSLRVIVSSILHRRLSVVREYHYTYVVDRSKVPIEAQGNVDAAGLLTDLVRRIFSASAGLRREMELRTDELPRPPIFTHGRAQDLARHVQDVDFVITSPPYFGMNDYVRSQYLSWLVFQWEGFDADLSMESGSRRRRRSQDAYDQYMTDMTIAFQAMATGLRPGAYMAIVIGSSSTKLAKQNEPVEALLMAIRSLPFSETWATTRRVRFRKINNTPYRSELIRVYQRV